MDNELEAMHEHVNELLNKNEKKKFGKKGSFFFW